MVAIEYKARSDGKEITNGQDLRKKLTDYVKDKEVHEWDIETNTFETMNKFYYVDPNSNGLVIVMVNQRDSKPILRFSCTRGTPLSSIEQAVLELNQINGLELVPIK